MLTVSSQLILISSIMLSAAGWQTYERQHKLTTTAAAAATQAVHE
jgi:hypothetical protein